MRLTQTPEGTAREREIPLIGVADVSLRGLRRKWSVALHTPEGTAREREIPLIGVADVSLRLFLLPNSILHNFFCLPRKPALHYFYVVFIDYEKDFKIFYNYNYYNNRHHIH